MTTDQISDGWWVIDSEVYGRQVVRISTEYEQNVYFVGTDWVGRLDRLDHLTFIRKIDVSKNSQD